MLTLDPLVPALVEHYLGRIYTSLSQVLAQCLN